MAGLLAVLVVGAGACRTDPAPGVAPPARDTARPDLPTPSSSPTHDAATASPSPSEAITPPRAVRAWQPPDGEVQTEAKQRAAEVALALTTHDADTSLDEVVATVTSDAERAQALARAAADLHRAGRWSRGRIVYPQMGGLTEARASVMVVVEQTVDGAAGDGARAVVSRTLDVRLVRGDRGWAFDRLASAGGTPAPRPQDLPPAAEAVLDDPRIALPDSARWDIHRGEIATTLLELMAELADRTPYGVVVLSSGHPFDVFGTGRQSHHTRGRAVDIHRVGDELVVARRTGADSRTFATARWLHGLAAVANLGSPWALDGHGGRSFTDAVHQDHLHVSTAAEAR